jgi:hypothetical protein
MEASGQPAPKRTVAEEAIALQKLASERLKDTSLADAARRRVAELAMAATRWEGAADDDQAARDALAEIRRELHALH